MNPYLEGNFAPVERELTALDLRVSGEVPRELDGCFARIGPNPVQPPDASSYHWFTGNGMVHGVRLRDGRAEWYRNRYVRDDEVVRAQGGPSVPGPRHSPMDGGGANTNVIRHAGKTFAIVEAGNVPVEIGAELDTRCRSDFDGTLPGGFTAHPKRDPDTGELHAIAYFFGWDHVQYVVVGVDGRVRKTVDVPVPDKPMVHDCAITARYVVILDLPVVFDIGPVQKGLSTLPYRWSRERAAFVGLLPREGGAADVIWSEVEPCFVFHPLNAYEDASGKVVLDVVRHPRMFAEDLRGPNEGGPTLERWTIDPAGGRVHEARLDERGQEFPRLDERRIGKPHRFGYTTSIGPGFRFQGLIKHDLGSGSRQEHFEGEGRHFMEPVFVPRTPDSVEDDGWILAYVYDESTDRSDVVILEAQDMSAPPVATIHLPARVPYGFHGNWIAED